MKLVRAVSRLTVGTILLLGGTTSLAAKPQVDGFTLENGIRVVSLYIRDSNNVSIFTYLPMGLASDGPGQAQWSHLIEHLVLRSPVALRYDQANGETPEDHMRLDFYGNVSNWQEGLSHHRLWLAGVAFDERRLELEKVQVNSECDTVANRLATHRFAFAAWGQGFRHGRKHAAVKGDVSRARLSEIQRHRDEHLVVLDKSVVCFIGGVDPKTLRAVVNKELGGIQSEAKRPAPVELHTGSHEMTWDIDARHIILSWPIPDVTGPRYGALMVAARLLMVRFNLDAELKALTGVVFAGTDLAVPEGRFFYVTASVRAEASFDDVRKKLEGHIDALKSDENAVAWAATIGQQISSEISQVMEPRLAKAQLPANASIAMAEGQAGLLWGTYEFRYGSWRSALAKRLAAITGKKVQRAAMKHLTDEMCSVFRIEPKMKLSKRPAIEQ